MRLTQTQETEYFMRIRQGDQLARTEFFEYNKNLVYQLLKGYGEYGIALSRQDLEQECFEALLIAIDKFEPNLGFKFSTYAVWVIKRKILRVIQNKSRLIRLPANRQSKVIHIQSLDAQIGDEEGMTLTEFIAGEENPENTVVENEVRKLIRKLLAVLPPLEQQIITLNYGIGGGEPKTLTEIAGILGYSIKTVGYHRRRALQKLKKGQNTEELWRYCG
jgi:RNA polymerase primary sigma factor